MRIPYSCLVVHDGVVLAGRGGQIQSFRINGGAPLSVWRHPAAEAEEKASRASLGTEPGNPVADTGEQLEQVALEPPAKKQRLESASPDDKGTREDERDENDGGGNCGEEGQGGKQRKKKGKKNFTIHRTPISRQTDIHVIMMMEFTQDGKYLVAVSGHDKAIWVFEHDGDGVLKELSKR
jgi:tRNA (guanine-N(7)-)-methyltransferase subunit TRM82